MSLIECENQGFRDIVHIRLSFGEHIRIDAVAKCFKHKFYLCRIYYTAIKFLPGICRCLFVFDYLDSSGISCFLLEFIAFADGTAIGCSLGLDAVNAVSYIHSVEYALFKRVVYNDVFVEEGKSRIYRSSCKPDQSCRVKIIEHFFPVAVNRAVTLVDYYHVEIIVG